MNERGEPIDLDDGDCPYCGGEGYTFDCFDGCCLDADIGCDDCTRPCSMCNQPGRQALKEGK